MKMLTYVRTFNPRWVITVLILSVIGVNLFQARWQGGKVITGDVMSYYAPLPGFFYDQAAEDQAPVGITGTAESNPGMAISYLPFFALAHLFATTTDFETDGFSTPYQFAILFSSLVYFVIALIFLAKLLRLHFPGLVLSLTLLCLSFGTNIFYYLTTGAGQTYPVSFLLVVLFLYQTVSWYQMRSYAAAAQLGLLLGALWLVNCVNIIVVLVFLLYDVNRWSRLRLRFAIFLRKPLHFLLLVLCCVMVMLPGFFYLKWQTGVFSGAEAAGFHFDSPRVFRGLFDFQRGWLSVSPLIVIALAGLFLLRGSLRMYAWSIPVFFVVYLYTVLSWHYGPSYGEAAMIDIYPVLAVPFGAFVYKLRRLGGWYKRGLYFTILMLLVLTMYRTFLAEELYVS